MDTTDTTHSRAHGYEGSAGVVLTPDECLIVLCNLERIPLAENSEIRRRLREFLKGRKK